MRRACARFKNRIVGPKVQKILLYPHLSCNIFPEINKKEDIQGLAGSKEIFDKYLNMPISSIYVLSDLI